MSDDFKPRRLPDLTEVMSSYFEDEWEPAAAAIDTLRMKLRAWLADGDDLEHGVLCVVTAAETYMNARRSLCASTSEQPSERRIDISEWLSAEVARFERLSDDLLAVKNLAFGVNSKMADRAFAYLNRLHPGFFFDVLGPETFGEGGEGSRFIAEVEAVRCWVDQRLPALRAASESMREPGQKESSAERVLAVALGREWKHLRDGYGLTGSRIAFFASARSLLAESGVDVPAQVDQLVKAYENHG
jgi:hypothetical protein